MTRVIEGLVWAKPCERPKGLPVARLRGTRAQGVAYERALAKALPKATYGQWFAFVDQNGPGYCQVDLFQPSGEALLVLECKLRWTLEGHQQVSYLYKPVLEAAYGKRAFGGVVCKILVPSAPVLLTRDLPSFERACAHAMAPCPVLHWMGNPATLWPVKPHSTPSHLSLVPASR